jgi:hypothetical protein
MEAGSFSASAPTGAELAEGLPSRSTTPPSLDGSFTRKVMRHKLGTMASAATEFVQSGMDAIPGSPGKRSTNVPGKRTNSPGMFNLLPTHRT